MPKRYKGSWWERFSSGGPASLVSKGDDAPTPSAGYGFLWYDAIAQEWRTSSNGGVPAGIGGSIAIGAPVAGGTPGSVPFIGAGGVLAQNNAGLFWDATLGILGIGTTIPGAGNPTAVAIRANRNGAAQNSVFSSFNAVSAATTSTFTIARGRGTDAAPSPILLGDTIGSFFFAGQTDTTPGNFSSGARLRAVALENFTGSTRGTQLFIDVANIGGVPNERMSISGAGVVFNEAGQVSFLRVEGDLDPNLLYVNGTTDRVAVGTDQPNHKFHVFGSILDMRMLCQTSSTGGIAGVGVRTGATPSTSDNSIFMNAYGSTVAGTTMGYPNAGSFHIDTSVGNNLLIHTATAQVGKIVFGPALVEMLTLAGGAAQVSGLVYNETGVDLNARFEGVGRPDLMLIDAGLGRVGINRPGNTHGATLDVDNLAVAESIFIARDNGVAVFTIGDSNLTTLGDGMDIAVGTVTGTRIATSAAQRLGFFGAAAVAQPSGVADAAGGAVIDAEARTAVNAVISRMESLGLFATV